MLTEVARHSEHRVVELFQGRQPRVRRRQQVRHAVLEGLAPVLLLLLARLPPVLFLPAAFRRPAQHGKAVRQRRREAEHLRHLAERRLRPVGDHVRGHRRAARAVLAEDILDHLLPLLAGREVDVDVRPALVLLVAREVIGQEALEHQLLLHRVDVRDAEHEAHQRVRRRAAALAEDAFPAGELDEVADDQEVAGKLQPPDQFDLFFHLRLHLAAITPVAPDRSLAAHRFQILRLLGHRQNAAVVRPEIGELVAQVLQRETRPLRQPPRVHKRFRQIGKQRRHLARRLDVAFAVRGEQQARGIERHVVAQAGEGIGQRTILPRRMERRVAGQQRQFQVRREIDQVAVQPRVVPQVVAVDLHEHVVPPEHRDQPVQCC